MMREREGSGGEWGGGRGGEGEVGAQQPLSRVTNKALPGGWEPELGQEYTRACLWPDPEGLQGVKAALDEVLQQQLKSSSCCQLGFTLLTN